MSAMLPPLIALEEHFDAGILHGGDELHTNLPPHLADRLHDLGNGRIKELDDGKTSLQVISHIGAPMPVDGCRQINDKLAAACAKYPTRLAGFAYLPMSHPQAAADELERAVTQLGFLGALVNNTTETGEFYDDEKFWPIFERAEKLDVPIYIHPSYPAPDLAPHYQGNFNKMATVMMSASGWGWHSETGLHILRLFASGLFDRYPKLKIVIGHMGEMIPYTLDRICRTTRHWGKFERDLRTVWRESIWVTTSGTFSLPPLQCLLQMSPPEKVMYSVDYPFSSPSENGLKFVEEVRRSGLMSEEEFAGFCHGNAERLLKIKAVPLS